MQLTKILKSRTVWTVALMAAFNAASQVAPSLNPGSKTAAALNVVFGAAAIYFRSNPKQALGITAASAPPTGK